MSSPATPERELSALRPKLIAQLQALHALKAGALRLFAATLSAVRSERDANRLPEVGDLLERMIDRFGDHEQVTREHEQALRTRLTSLGAGPSTPREAAMAAGALLRAGLGRLGGQNHGANARDAFVFEHLEIASWELLEELADRAGDRETAELARTARPADEDMAATIRRNFPNVLSLMLASEGLPTLRPSREQDDPSASEQQDATNED